MEEVIPFIVVCTPYQVPSLTMWPKVKNLEKIVRSIVAEDKCPLVPQLMFYKFEERFGYEYAKRCRSGLVERCDEVRVYTQNRTKQMNEIIEAAQKFGKTTNYFPRF